MEGILFPKFAFFANQTLRLQCFQNNICASIFQTCWHWGMIHKSCRYVDLMWSLFLAGHLFVSGIFQGLLVRRDNVLGLITRVSCYACSWGTCSQYSSYSWAADLGRQLHVQGFRVSVHHTCAWAGQIRRWYAAMRCRPTCNVRILQWKNNSTTFYLTCNHFKDMTQTILTQNLVFIGKWPM